MTRLISVLFLFNFFNEIYCLHIEWITESRNELEQQGWRKKELVFDNVIFKDLVGFFGMRPLAL